MKRIAIVMAVALGWALGADRAVQIHQRVEGAKSAAAAGHQEGVTCGSDSRIAPMPR